MSSEQAGHGSAGEQHHHHDHHKHEHRVGVSVSTTAGFYPAEGFKEVPAHQKVEVDLSKAKDELKIKDTTGWVATVTLPSGKREIKIAQSYKENGLSGDIEIDWGPSEGGGG
jgi:hypothetical protein